MVALVNALINIFQGCIVVCIVNEINPHSQVAALGEGVSLEAKLLSRCILLSWLCCF